MLLIATQFEKKVLWKQGTKEAKQTKGAEDAEVFVQIAVYVHFCFCHF